MFDIWKVQMNECFSFWKGHRNKLEFFWKVLMNGLTEGRWKQIRVPGENPLQPAEQLCHV